MATYAFQGLVLNYPHMCIYKYYTSMQYTFIWAIAEFTSLLGCVCTNSEFAHQRIFRLIVFVPGFHWRNIIMVPLGLQWSMIWIPHSAFRGWSPARLDHGELVSQEMRPTDTKYGRGAHILSVSTTLVIAGRVQIGKAPGETWCLFWQRVPLAPTVWSPFLW